MSKAFVGWSCCDSACERTELLVFNQAACIEQLQHCGLLVLTWSVSSWSHAIYGLHLRHACHCDDATIPPMCTCVQDVGTMHRAIGLAQPVRGRLNPDGISMLYTAVLLVLLQAVLCCTELRACGWLDHFQVA
jgi:hypothetical protein